MRVILEFTTSPVGEGVSLSNFVKKAVQIVKNSGISYMITPMGTIMEGDSLDELLNIVKRAHEELFHAGAKRVVTSIKIDDRRDIERKMQDKVEKVSMDK